MSFPLTSDSEGLPNVTQASVVDKQAYDRVGEMTDREQAEVVRLEAAKQALRREFLGWQCRLRQLAMREQEGRPSDGIRPTVTLLPDGPELGRITVLVIPQAPQETTAEFRHVVRRTQDPRERYKQALKLLSAHYYQYPDDFSDEITALFGPGPGLADRLIESPGCGLSFAQFGQRYHLPCRPRELNESDPAYQATLWHNAMFNPNIPGGARVVAFRPDWAQAQSPAQAGA